MNDPSRVRIIGPLAPHEEGLRAALEAHGYTPGTAALKLQLAVQLSRWMEGQNVDLGGLSAQRVEAFFRSRRKKVKFPYPTPLSLKVLMEHLGELGVLPAPQPAEPSALDVFLNWYRRYLLEERRLAEGTVARYVHVAGRFLCSCSSSDDLDLAAVTAAAASRFLIDQCSTQTAGWTRGVAVALRSLLRFLHLEGLIDAPLDQAVPTPRRGVEARLPKALTPAEFAALIASCDRSSVNGRRDRAVLLMLGKLGLRSGEVAGLQLDDVDWRRGELKVRGKGSRVDVLPLPVEVGRAVAEYVTKARPRVARGALFRSVLAPHGALDPVTVTGIVYRACERAGLPRAGAHRLRHTAATAMLRGGASLVEIAQVLRQKTPTATALYARVDRRALAGIAQPWPEGQR
jgi:site-specific recombinase XerD